MSQGRIRFVVLTTQRSGSTWVMSVLNGIRGVSAQGELFLPRRRSPERRWDSGFAYPRYIEYSTSRRRPLSIFEYLDAFFGASEAAGFKLMYSQLKVYPEILVYLMRRQIPVVHLVRRNHLDVLISFAVKRRIGQAHILADEERPTDVAVDLPTDTLLADVRRLDLKHRLARQLLRVSRLRHIEIAYEDLASDPRAFARVFEFLEFPPPAEPPASNIIRTRHGRQREVVRNFDQVRDVLEHSRFAYLLE